MMTFMCQSMLLIDKDVIWISSDESDGPIVISSESSDCDEVEFPKSLNKGCEGKAKEDHGHVPVVQLSKITKSVAETNSSQCRDRDLSKLRDKRNWSRYKAEKLKSRQRSVRNHLALPVKMGREVSDREELTATVGSVVTDTGCKQFLEECAWPATNTEDGRFSVAYGQIPLGKESARHSSSCSTCGSSSDLHQASENSFSVDSSPPRHTTKSSPGIDWFGPKKKLHVVKVEDPSDDELSDSLPELDGISHFMDQPDNDVFSSPPILQPYNSQRSMRGEALGNLDLSCGEIDPEMPNLLDSRLSLVSRNPSSVNKCAITCKDASSGKPLTLKARLNNIISKNKLQGFNLKKDKGKSKLTLDLHVSTLEPQKGSEDRHFLDILSSSPAKKLKLDSSDGKTYSEGRDSESSMVVHSNDAITDSPGTMPEISEGLSKLSCGKPDQSPNDELECAQKTDSMFHSTIQESSKLNQNIKCELSQPKVLPVSPYSDDVKRVCLASVMDPRKFLREIKSMGHDSEDEFAPKPRQRNQCGEKPALKETTRATNTGMAKKNCNSLYPSLARDFPVSEEMLEEAGPIVNFSATHVRTIEAGVEEGVAFTSHAEEYSKTLMAKYYPPLSVVNPVYRVGIFESKSISQSLQFFNLLSFVQRRFPGSVRVDWEMLTDIAEKLGLNKASLAADKCSQLNCSLALQLIIQVFRGELRTMDLSDPVVIRKSQAYKMLSGDHQQNHLKQLMNWISRVATSGEYAEICESYINQLEGDNPPNGDWDWPYGVSVEEAKPKVEETREVLPLLQQLMEIAIVFSNSNIDCARRLAGDLIRIYYYLPTLDHKRKLLETMSSDLLRFKLCQLFLEAHCDALQCCTDFPQALGDVLECLFNAVPPRSEHTPPMTPSDDDDVSEDLHISAKVSPESCDQLCLLQYYALYSYLKCVKSQCYKALRRRGSGEELKYRVSEIDKRTLQNDLQKFVDRLQHRLEEMSGGTTPFTANYLMLMRFLT